MFNGGAADFVQRLHGAMATYDIGHPPAGHDYSTFIPGAVLAYVEALLAYLEAEGLPACDDVAQGNYFYKRYRHVFVPRGQEYANMWSIPYPHELMVGEGKLLRMWHAVFHQVPFEFAEK